jgi:beta-lactamase regulating signal transducer with metallopeptidase domain
MDMLLQIGLGNALVASLLALLAAAVGRLGRRPALTHGLWLLVLIKLITPPLWPVTLSWPRASEPEPAVVEVAAPLEGTLEVESPPSTSTDPGDPAPAVAPSARVEESPAAPTAEPPLKWRATAAVPRLPWQALVLGVWLAGSGLCFLMAGWRIARFCRLLRYAQSAGPELRDEVRRVAARIGLRWCPGLWLVPGAVSPMLWALGGRPRLLVPAALLDRLDNTQRATLVAHELAHLSRGDHWVRLLELVTTGLYWWHPVVWWARREIGVAEEECCDAWVVGMLPAAARAYALALVKTVDFLSQIRPVLPPAASGIGQVQLLRRRLAMIMLGTTPKQLSGAGLLALLGLGAAALPILPTWAQEPPRQIEVTATAPDQPTSGDEKRVIIVRPSAEAGNARYVVQVDERRTDTSPDAARDEIELLQAQVDVKRAELVEGEAHVKQAQRHLERVNALGATGAISQEEIAKAQDQVELSRARLEPKVAQLKEAMVRLEQARRRLSKPKQDREPARGTTEKSAPRQSHPETRSAIPPTSAPKQDDPRVRELEQQLRSALEALKQTEVMREKARAQRDAANAAVDRARGAAEKANKDVIDPRDKARLKALEDKTRAEMIKEGVAAGREPSSDKARLKALEDKVDHLVRELEALRRELKSRSSRPNTPGGPVRRDDGAVRPDQPSDLFRRGSGPERPAEGLLYLVPAPTPTPERDPRSTPTVPLDRPPATDLVPSR